MCDNNYSIIINNIQNLETLCYSTVLLKGEIKLNNIKCNSYIINFEISPNLNKYQSQIFNNTFKQLVELSKGENLIKIQYCNIIHNLTLYYKPKDTEYCVVPIYIICKNHDGTFDSPCNENNSSTIACKKIAIGTKLIQCLLAEKFYTNGLNRKTFQLEYDIDSNAPHCRIFYSDLDKQSVINMNQEELWYAFGRELMTSEYANENFKYLAFISCTRYRGDKYHDKMTYNEIISITEGHAALGGGGLAIFGSATLHTWPTYLEDVIKCFQNETIVDRKQLMDDSNYRGTFGGCFATSLGSVCHELCHTFDLGHTVDGIMGRGFDNINKEFTVTPEKAKSKVIKVLSPEEQHCTVAFTPNINIKTNATIQKPCNFDQSSGNKNKKATIKTNDIYFTENCLILLYYHRWFNDINGLNYSIKYENNIIKSNAGICIIEIRKENSGLVFEWFKFSDEPIYEYEINTKKYCNESIIFIVEDIVGNIIKFKI